MTILSLLPETDETIGFFKGTIESPDSMLRKSGQGNEEADAGSRLEPQTTIESSAYIPPYPFNAYLRDKS